MAKRGPYNKKFKQHRPAIFEKSCKGLIPKKIRNEFLAQGINLNCKSIQSVKAPYTKRPYRLLEIEAVKYIINDLQQLTNLDKLIKDHIQIKEKNKKKLTKLWQLLTRKGKQLCGPESHLKHLFPPNREDTKKRRIPSQIGQEVLKQIIDLSFSQNQQQQKPLLPLQQQQAYDVEQYDVVEVNFEEDKAQYQNDEEQQQIDEDNQQQEIQNPTQLPNSPQYPVKDYDFQNIDFYFDSHQRLFF